MGRKKISAAKVFGFSVSLFFFFFSFTPELGLGAAKRSEMKPRSSQHHGQHPARPLPAPLRQNPEVAALA